MEKTIEGLVKGVLSGDQVIISGKMKKNSEEAPEEKQFFLSLLNAPRSGNSNNLEEESFAWDARDFLRQKVLGKVVKYTQDYRNNDRQYGQLYIDGVNINLELVRSGLAKVGFIPKNEAIGKSEYFTKLQAAEAEAKKAKLGMWTTDQATLAKHKRKLQSASDPLFDVQDVMKLAKEGKELDVVVDYVINCAVYSVFVKSLNTYIKLSLRFVAIPNARDQTIYKAGKSYVERLILHKDIKVVIHSVDGDRTFLGDLVDKKGGIANFILKNGYSKLFINNSTPYTTDELNAMKEAQRQAKKEKLRIWKNEKDEEGEDGEKGFAVGKEKKEKTSKGEFNAIVQQIHSGDSLTVKNLTTGEVSRIFLSHMKAPKFAKPNTEEQDQPWAFQAKEFLRKILVGKKIRAEHDYSKTLEDGKKMNFYSIFRFPESKEKKTTETAQSTEKNVNVEILEGGYASYIPPNPKLDDDVSKYLDSYQAAAQVAKEKKSGVNSTKFPGNSNYSDLIAANKTKKKEFINFLVNQKGLQCVVEYCFSGSKFKLRIEKNKCYVPFSLLGVKTFGKDVNTLELHDKFFREAQEFANDHILQREGTCDIIQADKVGNYFGYLTINGQNFGTTIIKEGLAVASSGQSNTPIVCMNDFKAAEKSAEQSQKGIFAYPNLSSFLKEGELVNTLPKGFEEKHSDIKLRITDYIDFNNFYINVLPNKNLNKIDSVLDEYNSGSTKGTPLEFPVKMNTLCAAKYSADGNYYRAKITKALKDEKYEVELLDFGTIDTVYKSDLIKLDNTIAMIEPQAVLCELAYLKYSKNSMKNALNKITDFVNLEAELPGKICYSYADNQGKTKVGVFVYQRKDKKLENTYHYDLLKLGFAKLDTKKTLPDYLKDLKEVQNKADKLGVGIWAENEATDYDEEEETDI
jgi:staphylococcal nuclease domain-containing protein 1